ncbi:MAG: hypothetical protein ACXVXJ_05830 [Mycobacteriaceae bacterium]
MDPGHGETDLTRRFTAAGSTSLRVSPSEVSALGAGGARREVGQAGAPGLREALGTMVGHTPMMPQQQRTVPHGR